MASKVEDNPKKSTRDLIWECFQKVTSENNLGTWLNEEYGDCTKMKAALERVVWARKATDCPCLIGIEPVATINECMVGIHQMDYSQDAKHGYFPHMATVIPHFKNILYRNFDPFREPLCLRFVSKGDRSIPDFSVKYVDGFCKGLICQAIAAIVDKLEIPDEELDSEDLAPLLVSLRFFKARYVHMVDQQSFFYEALRLGQETSEKQTPSALGAKKDDDDEHDGGEPDDDVKKRPATRPGAKRPATAVKAKAKRKKPVDGGAKAANESQENASPKPPKLAAKAKASPKKKKTKDQVATKEASQTEMTEEDLKKKAVVGIQLWMEKGKK